MVHSSQHQNSQQSAGQASSFPWLSSNPFPIWSQYANQSDFPLQLQVQRLRHDLAHAQKQIQEYEDLIASLYTALENKICVNCRAHFEKYATSAGLATSSTAGAVIVSPSSKPKFFLPRSANSPRSSAPSNRDRVFFKGHHTTPSRLTDSEASDFIQPNRSASVSSELIQPSSLSVIQQPISLPESSTSPKDIPNQFDWSVDFNSNVKPMLNMKLEHVLIPGAIVWRVRFSPDGKYLAVAVGDGRTYIYDVKTGVKSCFLVDNYKTRKRGIWSLCFSLDGKYLAVGDSDGELRIWEIATKRTRNIFREHTNAITGLDFSPDGRFLVSCSYDGTVRIWRMRDGFSKLLDDNSASSFYSVKFNPDGGYIAAGNDYGVLRIWNVRTSQLVEKWIAHGKIVRSVVFTLDGKGLVSCSRDGIWGPSFLELAEPGYGMTKGSTAGQKSKVMAHTNDVSSIVISPDGQWVVSGSADYTVHIWDLRSAAMQCTLKGHKNCVWSVDFCPTGNYLASGGEDGRVTIWRYEAA